MVAQPTIANHYIKPSLQGSFQEPVDGALMLHLTFLRTILCSYFRILKSNPKWQIPTQRGKTSVTARCTVSLVASPATNMSPTH